jgi:hypothetical protein
MEKTDNSIKGPANSVLFAKILFALLLIGTGLWGVYLIISVIYMIFTDIQNITFLGKLLNFPKEIKVIATGGNDALFVSGSIVGYIIAALLLSLGGRLAFRIIKLGADMVSKLDMKYFYDQLFKAGSSKLKKDEEDKSLLL